MSFFIYLLQRAEWIAAFLLVVILLSNCLTACSQLEPTPRSHPIPISSKPLTFNDGLHSVLVPKHDASSNGVSHAKLFVPSQ